MPLKSAVQWEIRPGIELTKSQIQSLQKDIVWLVTRKVKGRDVLVPQLYLAQNSIKKMRYKGKAPHHRHQYKHPSGDIRQSQRLHTG